MVRIWMTPLAAVFVSLLMPMTTVGAAEQEPLRPLTVIVMDPLSAPLACDCVKGYAQRKYEKLAEFLQSELGRPVRIFWSESLSDALEEKSKGKADLIIGKHSVVLADATEANLKVVPVAQLSGKDGSVTQTGLFIVRKDDPAQKTSDLTGYRILFGPADCDEKSAAPMALLKKSSVAVPSPVETSPSCSDAAKALMELPTSVKAAAVVSSYAQPLLEGCGSIKKGDVRVIGESDPVPFITAFVNAKLDKDAQAAVTEALLKVGEQAGLLIALETKAGFLPWTDKEAKPAATDSTSSAAPQGKEEWPQFRGPFRNGTVGWLPEKLPAKPQFAWEVTLPSDGVGGLAVAAGCVIVGGRDSRDQQDSWTCLDAATGQRRWQVAYPAAGRLDYGNSPRATPLIAQDHVWLQGALGHLHCVRLDDGSVVWNANLVQQFGMPILPWGLAGSPLMVGHHLILQPGGRDAALVALEPFTGEVVWSSPGLPPGHASLVAAEWDGHIQLIGYDKLTLGGWDVANGKRLWTVAPKEPGDFNVPSPIIFKNNIVVVSENNGARVYAPRSDSQPGFTAVGQNNAVSPDSHSPVICGDRLIGIHNGLHALSLHDNLASVWRLKDRAFRNYGTLLATTDKVLALSFKGELILVDPHQNEPVVLSRLQLTDDEVECWSHPALADRSLFIRLGRSACRLDLAGT